MEINVITRFDLESALYEAKQRCYWFIDSMGKHGLTNDLFKEISTERICEIYNVNIDYFKLKT